MVQRIYVKDLSFEAPNSPTIFQENWTPEINVGLNSEIRRVADNLLELALKVTVDAKHEGKSVFLVEVVQGGVFMVQGFTEEEVNEGDIRQAVGCSACNEGYKGRVGIYEVVRITPDIARLIMEEANAIDIKAQCDVEGFNDLRRSALRKVAAGMTSLEEANRITVD